MKLRLVIVTLALVAGLARADEPAAEPPPAEPVFSSLDAKMVHVSDHRGDVVLLHFWATWCGPCRTEMPRIVAIDRDLRAKGLRVIGAAANGRDDVEAVKKFMAEQGMTFEEWCWVSAKDMRWYGVGPGIPASVLIDRQGRVAWRSQGMIDDATARAEIAKLLAQEPPK